MPVGKRGRLGATVALATKGGKVRADEKMARIESFVFLPKVSYVYTTLPSARKARSHLPFQGRYNRLDLRLQFAITTSLYMLPERELSSP